MGRIQVHQLGPYITTGSINEWGTGSCSASADPEPAAARASEVAESGQAALGADAELDTFQLRRVHLERFRTWRDCLPLGPALL